MALAGIGGGLTVGMGLTGSPGRSAGPQPNRT